MLVLRDRGGRKQTNVGGTAYARAREHADQAVVGCSIVLDDALRHIIQGAVNYDLDFLLDGGVWTRIVLFLF